jgi:hypothetical protein
VLWQARRRGCRHRNYHHHHHHHYHHHYHYHHHHHHDDSRYVYKRFSTRLPQAATVGAVTTLGETGHDYGMNSSQVRLGPVYISWSSGGVLLVIVAVIVIIFSIIISSIIIIIIITTTTITIIIINNIVISLDPPCHFVMHITHDSSSTASPSHNLFPDPTVGPGERRLRVVDD